MAGASRLFLGGLPFWQTLGGKPAPDSFNPDAFIDYLSVARPRTASLVICRLAEFLRRVIFVTGLLFMSLSDALFLFLRIRPIAKALDLIRLS